MREEHSTPGRLRIQSLDEPVIAIACVFKAIVQAMRAGLPELEALGDHPEAAPVRRARYVAAGVLLAGDGEAIFQRVARVQRPVACRSPWSVISAAAMRR